MNAAINTFEKLPSCLSASQLLPDRVSLVLGESIDSVELPYSWYGDISKPVIVVLGGISADQYVADANIDGHNVQGWWSSLIGYGRAIDLNYYSVVSINYLDAQSCTRQINNTKPIEITTYDQATILKLVLDELRIKNLECLIGSSYGGMVGLAFAEKYPNYLKQLITICCTDKSSSKNTAYRSLQRQILSFAIENNDVKRGLVLARSLATLGYRGSEEIETRFANQINFEKQQVEFPVEQYLENQGEKFANHFIAQRFLDLSLSVDLHKVDCKKIQTDCLCIGIQNDLIAPSDKVKKMTIKIGSNAKFTEISSKSGHDGFLKEFEKISKILKLELNNNA